jgi:DNA polymerase I-like protein with 3'-5' exonuclease and polymerase domains
MLLVADVENKVTSVERFNAKGKKTVDIDNSPFNPDNYLVSTGLATKNPQGDWHPTYHFHSHIRLSPAYDKQRAFDYVQGQLDRCTLLIGHNVKYDLQWLWASGFQYDGPVYDTALAEYVLARGQKGIAFSLDASTGRRGVALKKGDLISEYWDAGIGFEAMPITIVEDYGRGDIISTGQLYDAQVVLYKDRDNSGLSKTLHLMNTFCRVLARMEYDGIKIDEEALASVETEFLEEQRVLRERMEQICRDVIGDTPVNLDSPEQLARVIYSRQLNDKKAWGQYFIKDGNPINRKISKEKFKRHIDNHTTIFQKTRAEQCPKCKGKGYIIKTKLDGSAFKRPNKCPVCDTTGFLYTPNGKVAGFKFNPADANWVSANGFSTSKEELSLLAATARSRKMEVAEDFLEGMIRLNAIGTYLDSFVKGIVRGVRMGGLLHCKFNQIATSTGRLSSSQPNMQNMPRGNTFPVKKAIVSRFKGGKIFEVDFSQLEFRCAAHLAKDEVAIKEINEGFDVHSHTAKVLTDAGEPRSRQEAKARTFAPLYGATQGSPAEMAYYEAFRTKYQGIARWHKDIEEMAIATKKLIIPSGREYYFPFCKRNSRGGATGSTKIRNYGVQGFATGDIVPWAVIIIYEALRSMKSVVINTVHDSIVIDVHPDELDIIVRVIDAALQTLEPKLLDYYGVSMLVPLLYEGKIGPNWMQGDDVDFSC